MLLGVEDTQIYYVTSPVWAGGINSLTLVFKMHVTQSENLCWNVLCPMRTVTVLGCAKCIDWTGFDRPFGRKFAAFPTYVSSFSL